MRPEHPLARALRKPGAEGDDIAQNNDKPEGGVGHDLPRNADVGGIQVVEGNLQEREDDNVGVDQAIGKDGDPEEDPGPVARHQSHLQGDDAQQGDEGDPAEGVDVGDVVGARGCNPGKGRGRKTSN